MTKEDEDKRAIAELAGSTMREERLLEVAAGLEETPRIKKYICGTCYTPIYGEPFFGASNRARHRTCASGLVALPWTGEGVGCPGCSKPIADGELVVILNHDDPAKDGAWHQPCADLECKPIEAATDPKPGRIGGALSKRLAEAEAPKYSHAEHNVARMAVESVLEETDADFVLVASFKKHAKQGVVFRISSGASVSCDSALREILAHVTEATTQGISSFLHTSSGANVIVLDAKERPQTEPEGD